MYPVCRGRPYCLRCGTERGRLEAARIEVPEGCYRRRDGRVKRAPREEAGWDWVSEGETEREERERERGKKREGGRGEDCRGRVRVMICRVSRSTSDDSDPSSRRVGRETKEGHQESQPGIFFPRPRPRLISFPAFFLFLLSFSFIFFLFNSGASNYNSHETLVPRYLFFLLPPSFSFSRDGWYSIAYTFFFPLFHPFA